MLLLAWKTFLDRWQVFIGAVVTVCLGVALVQSSLLALIAAATPPIPPGLSASEVTALRDGYGFAITLLSMQLALATFVAVFIVSSTFAFTVAQRRPELALIRLTGAARQQVRSLLVGEAVLLGLIGSVLGMVLGLPLMRLQVQLLERFEFVPPGFETPWRWWVVLVSLTTGVLIAVLGVLAASRQASRVQPLEALRDSGKATGVMTGSRWVIGLLFIAGGVFLLWFFPGGDAVLPAWFLQLTPFIVSVPLVIGFSALAPLIVPLVGRLFGLVLRSPEGELTVANLRSDARRSASTAAPIMVLVAFVASIGGTLDTVNESARQETMASIRGDLVVTTDESTEAELTGVDGVDLVSEETAVLLEVRFSQDGAVWYEADYATVVDPTTYTMTHDVEVSAGDLDDLNGAAIAVSPNAWERDWPLGETLQLRIDDAETPVQVVALLAPTVAGPNYLLSRDLVPPGAGPWQNIVQLADGADASSTAAQLAEFGSVTPVDQWVDDAAAQADRMTLNIMIVLLGTAMLYTVIAMVNAVVIAASARRREFATARVTGLTRSQVVRVAFWESQAVTVIGLFLGGAAAAASVWGVAVALRNLTGVTVVSVPWPLLAALVIGAAVVVGATSAITTLSATRTPPIQLVASRE